MFINMGVEVSYAKTSYEQINPHLIILVELWLCTQLDLRLIY